MRLPRRVNCCGHRRAFVVKYKERTNNRTEREKISERKRCRNNKSDKKPRNLHKTLRNKLGIYRGRTERRVGARKADRVQDRKNAAQTRRRRGRSNGVRKE